MNVNTKLQDSSKKKRVSFTFFEDDAFIQTLNKLLKYYEGLSPLEAMKVAVAQQLKKEERESSLSSGEIETMYINQNPNLVKNILKKDKEYDNWDSFEESLRSGK
jgi:hypothetical protein